MRRLLLLLSLLPLNLYAQGAGTPPYRGVNNWPLIFGTDNLYDIGAVGATRPRTGYFGTSVITPALTVSGLTATRVPFAGTGGLISDDADMTFATDTLTATKYAGAIGLNTTPTYGFTGQSQTGMYSPAALQIGFTANGTYAARITSGGIGLTSAKQYSWCSDLSCAVSVDAGLYRHAAGVVRNTDGGTTNVRGFLGGGAAVASATALPVPTGAWYHVTGTTTVTSQTVTNIGHGTCFTLVFDSTVTVTDGGNLKLNGNLSAVADTTLGLCCDTNGNCYETHRSIN